MERDCQKLFKTMGPIEPRNGLSDLIVGRVRAVQIKTARLRLSIFGGVALLSLAGLVPALQYLVLGFYESGFYRYLSVILSDGSLVFAYWRDFTLLLAEAFPALAVVIVAALILVFLSALRSMSRTAGIAFLSIQTA